MHHERCEPVERHACATFEQLTLADDATVELHGDAPADDHGEVTSEWWDRYPGW